MDNTPPKLPESLLRRSPTPEERDTVRQNPELLAEARLTRALSKLTPPQVGSNFTARVLAGIDLADQAAHRQPRRRAWRLWLPRLAFAGIFTFAVVASLERYQGIHHQAQLARQLASIAGTPPPNVEALENLEAIQSMSQSAHADGELLAALQ